MKIIGNTKDYYDYLLGIYGIDNAIIYDRRNAEELKYNKLYNVLNKNKQGKIEISSYGTYTSLRNEWIKTYLVLEVGYNQYIFEIVQYYSELPKFETKLIDIREIKNRISNEPIVMYLSHLCTLDKTIIPEKKSIVKNPLLKDTWLTSEIPAKDIYDLVYNYLISLKEPKTIDNRTDVEKLESHGFDKKHSFRHN